MPAVRVVALRRGSAAIQIAPPPSTPVEGGDLLVVVGERAPLLELASHAAPSGP